MSLLQAIGGTREGVLAHSREVNGSRFVPTLPDFIKEVSDQHRVYIFNVGPWPHKRELGSAGTYLIPACLEGKEYSEPLILNGIEDEPYPINERTCTTLPKAGKAGQLSGSGEGSDLAQQIIGVGPHVAPNSSLIPFGVFASTNKVPTKAELVKAQAALNAKYLELVRLASEAHARGPNAVSEVIDPDWHFVAARKLLKTVAECPWLANSSAPAKRENCPSCGTVYDIGIMKCRDCGFILDKARYDDAVKKGLFAAA